MRLRLRLALYLAIPALAFQELVTACPRAIEHRDLTTILDLETETLDTYTTDPDSSTRSSNQLSQTSNLPVCVSDLDPRTHCLAGPHSTLTTGTATTLLTRTIINTNTNSKASSKLSTHSKSSHFSTTHIHTPSSTPQSSENLDRRKGSKPSSTSPHNTHQQEDTNPKSWRFWFGIAFVALMALLVIIGGVIFVFCVKKKA